MRLHPDCHARWLTGRALARRALSPLIGELHPGWHPPESPRHHAVLPGEEASRILIQGLPSALEEARSALERKGIEVARSGRWMGEPVSGIAFDWFLRCPGRLDPGAVRAVLGSTAPVNV